jgi:uridine kinase
MRPFVVGIAGGSGAGKSTLARELARAAGSALVVEVDWYYRDLSHLPAAERAEWNFDHPDALDWDLLRDHVRNLQSGRAVRRPVYDFVSHTRLPHGVDLQPQPLAVVEGILALHDPALRELLDLKIFVEAPRDLRLSRRLRRDVAERGRSDRSVRLQFERTVDPMHELFVAPSGGFADLRAVGAGALQQAVSSILAVFQGRDENQ